MASDRQPADEPEYGDDIDQSAFEQILEMDEEDEGREFSSQIVFDFFDQAVATFEGMDEAVQKEELEKLSQLGHFLKGSSATLGLIKVRDACEKIQNWGHCSDELNHNPAPLSKKDALKNIKNILPTVKEDCAAAERILRAFYNAND
ncbi:MAG: hypothetical protein GOMPHAMPRED_006052 [Gomphillus americanus]|uniref:HPt domain-containing protein n=1 Tax=Gomphillus americanus TaxID=1940652 RepID=A0A8H3HYR5_9LECA|nr:MAG: hypothetical protein GOMPHAMPRED_006052 [Gomphillus americanus]